MLQSLIDDLKEFDVSADSDIVMLLNVLECLKKSKSFNFEFNQRKIYKEKWNLGCRSTK